MKRTLTIFLLTLTIGCSKEKSEQPAPCVTCTETVNYNNSLHVHLVYTRSQNTYCNGEEKNVVQGETYGSGTTNEFHWSETVKMECK